MCRPTRVTSWMQKPLPKRSNGRGCVLCRSRPKNSWICKRCIGCASVGDAAHGGGQPDPQSSSRTWTHATQGPQLCGSATSQDLGRRRVEAIGFFSCSVGATQIGTGAAHCTHGGDGPGHPKNGERE